MPLTLAEVKSYLRVSDDSEDMLISAELLAAEAYIKGKLSKTRSLSGQSSTGEALYINIYEDKLYQQAVLLMVSHWFENRNVFATGTIVTMVGHTVDAILTHIEGCGDYL